MSDYTRFFLSSNRGVAQLELIEISHPNFTKTYRAVRNFVGQLQVVHENAVTALYDYYPLKIARDGMADDLDSKLRIDLGDLGEVISAEWDAIRTANGTSTKPTVKFRAYRSDLLTAPLFGPYVYEIESFSGTRDGVSFVAQAPKLNVNGTGEIYALNRFPGLRGFL